MTDVGRRYEASTAYAPFDSNARAAAAVRMAADSELVDVRVSQLSSAPWTSTGAAGVSMRDMFGASLVTFQQHLDMPEAAAQDDAQPLKPKAVYVQYQSQDPVTGRLSPVVVPASMSLDVFADPEWFGAPQEEEKIIEEEKDDNEEEDRQKLRSSIKGDPILMRAKPAPPPDPYFSPLRQETMLPKLCGADAIGPLFAGFGSTASSSSKAVKGPPPFKMHVEAASTMSSFLKAAGKDKYSRCRINEIDHILKASSKEQSEPPSQVPPQSGNAPEGRNTPRGPGSRCSTRPGHSDPRALTSQMAVLIHRMPQFHNARSVQQSGIDPDSLKPMSPEAFSEAADDGSPRNDAESSCPPQAFTEASMEDGRCWSPVSAAMSRKDGGSTGRRNSISQPVYSRPVHQQQLQKKGPGTPGRSRCQTPNGKQKLRDLDPHVDITKTVPSQRLHSNWPDGPRRQLARHFYGLTPAQILEEEAKERERGAVQRKKEVAAESEAIMTGMDKDACTALGMTGRTADTVMDAKAKARRDSAMKGLERSFINGGQTFHRLEIRIRNKQHSERVVVGRKTECSAGQNKFRKCVLLDGQQFNMS